MSEEPIYALCAFMLPAVHFVGRRNAANSKPRGLLLSLGKAATSVTQAVPRVLGDGSGADPSQKAPCQGQPEALGKY